MGPGDGRDGCGKSRPHRYPNTGPPNTQRVYIPTELSRPAHAYVFSTKTVSKVLEEIFWILYQQNCQIANWSQFPQLLCSLIGD